MGAPGWEHDMPTNHRSEWATVHHLDSIDVQLRFLDGAPCVATIIGRADTKRSSLWVHEIVPELYDEPVAVARRLSDDLEKIMTTMPDSREQLHQALLYGTLTLVEQSPLWP